MNLEAVVITGLSAEKSEFFRFLKLIISRLPRTLASRETENVFLQFLYIENCIQSRNLEESLPANPNLSHCF